MSSFGVKKGSNMKSLVQILRYKYCFQVGTLIDKMVSL
jgi:hypothetical protein